MDKIYLHTGSNIGHRENNLEQANELIVAHIGPIKMQSGLYETEAWGLTDQPNFLNQALEIESGLSASEVMEQIINIELKMGRVREQKWAPRLIDIDILFFGDQIIKTKELTVPHPHMHKRNFVLVPLLEIASDFVHPEFNLSIRQLYKLSIDPLNVKAQTSQ